MTFMKFSENLAERLLGTFLDGYFLIVIPDRMVRIDRYLGCIYTPGVLSRVKVILISFTAFCFTDPFSVSLKLAYAKAQLSAEL